MRVKLPIIFLISCIHVQVSNLFWFHIIIWFYFQWTVNWFISASFFGAKIMWIVLYELDRYVTDMRFLLHGFLQLIIPIIESLIISLKSISSFKGSSFSLKWWSSWLHQICRLFLLFLNFWFYITFKVFNGVVKIFVHLLLLLCVFVIIFKIILRLLFTGCVFYIIKSLRKNCFGIILIVF